MLRRSVVLWSFFISLSFVLYSSVSANAQVITGTPPFGSFSGRPFDTVNLANLDVHFAIPILNNPGRGIPFTYGITYDSLVWTPVSATGAAGWTPVGTTWGWGGIGSSTTGYVLTQVLNLGCYVVVNGQRQQYNYLEDVTEGYIDSSNTFHPVVITTNQASTQCNVTAVPSGSATATDGSGFTLNVSAYTSYTVTDVGGNQFFPGSDFVGYSSGYSTGAGVIDTNGNELTTSVSGSTTTLTDTLGNSALTIDVVNASKTTYSYSPPSGAATYTVNYTNYTVATDFGVSGIPEYPRTANELVSSIVQAPTGATYQFTYETTPGSCTPLSGTYSANCVTARIASVTLPSGGTITYAYTGVSNGIESDGSTAGLTRTLSPGGEWKYSRGTQGSNWITNLYDPASNLTSITFSGIYETSRTVQQYASGGYATLLTKTTCYNKNYSNCGSATVGTPISQIDAYTTLPSGSTRLSETLYNSNTTGPPNGLLTDDKEYDYGVTTGSAPGHSHEIKETTISYASLGNNIQNRPSTITVYDWSSGTQTQLASTTYSYGSAVTSTTGTPQHISISGARGNPTGIASWVSGSTNLTKSFSYYDTGNVNVATDVNSAPTTYSYGSGSCGNSFPTSVTLPQIPGESFQMSYSETWDCPGGRLASITDLNGNPTNYTYADPLWRQTLVQYPDGGSTSTTYSTGSPWTVTASSLISGATYLTNVATYDGLGREVQTALTSDPGGTSYRAITYNALGEVYQVYNPTRCNPPTTNCGQEGTWGATTYSYDALGRMTQLTHPDNSYISAVYTGRATEVTDEGNGSFNVQRISQVDGLGRLTSVCEVTQTDPGGGSSCQQDIGATGFLTSYTYDALGNLLTVAQGSLNGRTYKYDGLSRLTSASDPESGTIYYGYNSSGDLYQRISPTSNDTGTIGTTTTYTHDLLHRLTNVTYSHSDGSTASLPVAFYYDEPNPWGVTATNYKGRLSQTAAQNFTVGSVYSYDPMGRISNEWQCTPMDCGTTATYFTYGYDKLGNLTSSNNNSDGITYTYGPYNGADELTQMQSSLNDSQHPGTLVQFNTYSAFGKPEQIVYGNGVTTSLGYDARMRLYFSNQGTPYDYNIMKSSSPFVTGYAPDNDILYGNDSVNGVWSYTYDALNRLVTAKCNTSYSCPTAAGVTYTYDRYGNRLAESVTSGSGAQASYGFNANNQIDVSGVTYDEAGNVIASGTGIGDPFSYDDENRVTGAGFYSATYVYDGFGNRVRSTVNGQTNDFLHDLNGETIDQFANGTLSRSEAYAGGMHIATYENGTTYFDSSDWLSTFRVRTDISGTNVESCTSLPFGEDLTCTLPLTSEVSPLHFTGQEHDWESGNDHFPFRYYNEVMGRWLTPDPAGLVSANPANPQTWNRYAYVNNNPLRYTDPTGLQPYRFYPPAWSIQGAPDANGWGGDGWYDGMFIPPVDGMTMGNDQFDTITGTLTPMQVYLKCVSFDYNCDANGNYYNPNYLAQAQSQYNRLSGNLASIFPNAVLDPTNCDLTGGHCNFLCIASCPDTGRYDDGIHVEDTDGGIWIHDDTVSPWTGQFTFGTLFSALFTGNFWEHGFVDLIGGTFFVGAFPQ